MNNNFLQLFLQYRTYIKQVFPYSLSYILNGELFIKIPFKHLLKFCFFLHQHSHSQFKVLSDICAVDYPWKKNRFELFYNLLSIAFNTRLTIITTLNEKNNLHSISPIFQGATWFERELWDMFGIFFINNLDLRRILTDYGFKGHPLRKDFPLTGFIEVRYYHNEKRILVEEVSLTQDYRTFYFGNSWSKNI